MRKEENKEEPKSSKELAYLMQANKKNFNNMSSSFSTLNTGRKSLTNGWSKSTDDSSLSDESSSTSSSGSSVYSNYKARMTVRALRRPFRRKVKKKVKYNKSSGKNSTKISLKSVTQLVVIGENSKGKAVNPVRDEIKVDSDESGGSGVIKSQTNRSSASGESSASGRSSNSSSSESITPPKNPPNGLKKPPVTPSKAPKITCDICRPSKMFASWKYLFRHMKKYHGSKKRVLMTCKCGRKVRKEKFTFHQRYYCSKSLVSCGDGGS